MTPRWPNEELGQHPAKFPVEIIALAANLLVGYDRVLDPFAGSGRVHHLRPSHWTCGVEIESDWEQDGVGVTILGNSRHLPFRDSSFDAIFTSPVYGNRMSDHHNAKEPSPRATYRHRLTHDLHRDNAGQMFFWQPTYKALHESVWGECERVLRPGGRFILNSKDFFRTHKGLQKRYFVTDWHTECLLDLGLHLVRSDQFETAGNGYGANGRVRVDAEDIFTFVKP